MATLMKHQGRGRGIANRGVVDTLRSTTSFSSNPSKALMNVSNIRQGLKVKRTTTRSIPTKAHAHASPVSSSEKVGKGDVRSKVLGKRTELRQRRSCTVAAKSSDSDNVEDEIQWRVATVVENRSESVQGDLR